MQKQPKILTSKEAEIRAKALDRIARGQGFGQMATGRQRLQARRLAGAYLNTAKMLREVDSE